MGKRVVLYIAQSLDGYIDGPHGDMKWIDEFEGSDSGYKEFYSSVGHIIMGYKTYSFIQDFEPFPYAPPVKCAVFTHRTLKSKHENVEFVSSSISEYMRKISENETEDAEKEEKIVWLMGGANLFGEFLRINLVDEMRITTLPVILGGGTKLFQFFDVEDVKNLGEKVKFLGVGHCDNCMIETKYEIVRKK